MPSLFCSLILDHALDISENSESDKTKLKSKIDCFRKFVAPWKQVLEILKPKYFPMEFLVHILYNKEVDTFLNAQVLKY